MPTTDRIEKTVRLAAPVSRVWRAIGDPIEFGRWFGVELSGAFAPGATVRARFGALPPASVFDDLARRVGLEPCAIRAPAPDAVFCTIEDVEPEARLAFRWIPFGVDASVDPDAEPTTLVELCVEAAPDGTTLTIVESGFDRVPDHRRERAFRMNDLGWTAQAENVRRYVEGGGRA